MLLQQAMGDIVEVTELHDKLCSSRMSILALSPCLFSVSHERGLLVPFGAASGCAR